VFKYKEGEKYRYLTQMNEKVYFNEEYSHSAEILYKIAVAIEQVKDKKGHLLGIFQISEKIIGDETYQLQDEESISKFWRDEKGNYETSKNTFYPLIRDIPNFPKSDIKQGATWEATGDELHDLREYGYDLPIHSPVKVKYSFEGVEKKGENQIGVIKVNYSLYRELPELFDLPTLHPVNILGRVEQTVYWDFEKGRVDSYEEDFHVVYTMNNYEVVDFVGTSQGELLESPEMNKKKIEEEIKKSIDDQKIRDTTVKADESGVTITLEDINFKAESEVLMPEEQAKLAKIGDILKKYPERDIFIAGHTALAGTEEGRQTLSQKRAKAVSDYLLMLGVRKENQLTYKGFGARFPVADNSTELGMKKNRRVEIKILEN
jgi:outer membrane protein OmpA-like peptidoglycan-associated protein